jgi:hypothetical protein
MTGWSNGPIALILLYYEGKTHTRGHTGKRTDLHQRSKGIDGIRISSFLFIPYPLPLAPFFVSWLCFNRRHRLHILLSFSVFTPFYSPTCQQRVRVSKTFIFFFYMSFLSLCFVACLILQYVPTY